MVPWMEERTFGTLIRTAVGAVPLAVDTVPYADEREEDNDDEEEPEETVEVDEEEEDGT